MYRKRFIAIFAAVVFAFGHLLHAQSATPLVGFTGPEIYPIDDQISFLHAADLTGNGLNDLVIADNLKSKIVLLYNRTGKTNPPDTTDSGYNGINDLPPDARFRMDSIPTDERIASMAVIDLNSDKLPDIAFYGDGKDL